MVESLDPKSSRKQSTGINEGIESDLGMPPIPERWPTADDLRRITEKQPDPRDSVRLLRRRVREAGSRVLHFHIGEKSD